MSEATITSERPMPPALTKVATDGTTIGGTGTRTDPLRVIVAIHVATLTSQLPNGESVPILPGQPVTSANDTARLARSNSTAFATVVGVVTVGADPTLPVSFALSGAVSLPTAAWDKVTGQTGGLSIDAIYYLDASGGKLTTTPPSTPGLSIVEVGRALSGTVLAVTPLVPVLL